MGKRIGQYVTLAKIGSGAYADVWTARNEQNNGVVAIKIVPVRTLSTLELENLDREIHIMRSLRHPNIVNLHDVLRDDKHIYIVMEYCAGGDLFAFMQRRAPVPEGVVRNFVTQLASAISFLHENKLVHRDLKPQNILLTHSSDSACLKICDFGFARYAHAADDIACGSPMYTAPEILKRQAYDSKADLWSIGTILYELLFGKSPFEGRTLEHLLWNVENAQLVYPPAMMSLSQDCRHLLENLLQKDPKERLTIRQFIHHKFVSPETSGWQKFVKVTFPDLMDDIIGTKRAPSPPAQLVRASPALGMKSHATHTGIRPVRAMR
eukprot:tig00020912_g15796.t1